MPGSSAVAVLGCALLVVCAAKEAKKLRNVIITSFGELPYEPVQGFVQADVFPVGLDGRPQTMDVALRTGILVEDPNEKKTDEDENSAEDDETSPNQKRHIGEKSRDKKEAEETEDDFLAAPLVDTGYRTPKGHRAPQEDSEQYPSSARNFGYEFHQTRRQKRPPYPADTNSNGFNINREYYGDLGEGWNLQDAEEVLRGRNYNILVQTPKSYPVPSAREIPPPANFYPFPDFNYSPIPRTVFNPYASPEYFRNEDYDADTYRRSQPRKRTQDGRSINRQDVPLRQSVEYQPRAGVFYGQDYLRGA